jgi:uncharacterized protein DUF1588/uncharacterized protein DUF1592/uncharacterized protein DUF1585/uncharacterized protein DUF1595/uncharacterized protein DUF1587
MTLHNGERQRWPWLCAALLAACSAHRPAVRPTPVPAPSAVAASVRRLTVKQYKNTLTDLFGAGLVFPPLDEEPGTGGFSTTGAAQVATSIQGAEQYLNAADAVARQIFTDESRRDTVAGCVPRLAADRDCAARFLTRVGRRAFRRPLTADERDQLVGMAMATALRRNDFWAGLRMATAVVLASPSFIYVVDRGRDGGRRLTSHELAAKLSLFLWNTSPDELLLDAADRDELADDAGVRRHVLRLLAAPRAREGMRNFFSELFRLDAAEQVSRDKEREPKVAVRAIGRKMAEETLLVLDHNVFVEHSDFRDLFTTPNTFLDRDMATLYRVRVVDGAMFTKIMLPLDGPRRGLLGHASFLAGTSAPDKTSPTVRGKFVREVLLCEPVQPPPPNVDTNLPPATGQYRTMRERLEEHRADVSCARCHRGIDSIGLAFERFDFYGEYREKENGETIDPSGELDGRPFANPVELGEILSRDPRVPACLMRNLYSYATGRIPEAADQRPIERLRGVFQDSGYKFHDALVALATSPDFTTIRGD